MADFIIDVFMCIGWIIVVSQLIKIDGLECEIFKLKAQVRG